MLWKDDVEREINGHGIKLLKAVIFPSPHHPASAAGRGGCSPRSATGKRQIKPDLPLAGTGGLSDTATSVDLSDCPDLTSLLTTFWFIFLLEVGLQAENTGRARCPTTTPPCRQNRTQMAHASSVLLRQTLSTATTANTGTKSHSQDVRAD